MMKTYLLTALICTAFLYGCKDSTTITNSGGGTLVGDLKGRVYLMDQNGNPISNGRGVLVSCEGTSYSAITDSTGFWVIHDLPTRTYSIAYTKEGFDTIKNTSYTFVGGGTQWILQGIAIVQHPTFEVVLDAVAAKYKSDGRFDYYSLYGHTVDNWNGLVRIVISRIQPFTPYDNNNVNIYIHTIRLENDPSFIEKFSPDDYVSLHNFDTLYVTAYPASFANPYFDVQTGKYVYSGLGKQSNVLQIIKK